MDTNVADDVYDDFLRLSWISSFLDCVVLGDSRFDALEDAIIYLVCILVI